MVLAPDVAGQQAPLLPEQRAVLPGHPDAGDDRGESGPGDQRSELPVPRDPMGRPPPDPRPSLSISPIADVVIGDPAQVHLTTDVAGQPYDNATVLYRIIEPAHETVLQTGQAVRSGPGAWDVDLVPAFTANLSEGMYRFEAAATGTEASLTTYANRTFNV